MRSPDGQLLGPMPTYPRKVTAKPFDFFVIILLPWLIFSLIVGLYAFAYEEFAPLVWALVCASGLLALLFISMGGASGKPAQVALGFLVLTSVCIAVPVGLMVESNYMSEFWQVDSGAGYRTVSPLAPSTSYADASIMEFERSSFVDAEHSLGYMRLGEVYCVAPVVGPHTSEESATPQYWAIGKNCCGKRGGFSCGDVAVSGAHSGVALREGASNYETAVRMAVSAYELKAPANPPIFVRWTLDADAYKTELWNGALTFAVIASGIHLVGSGAASLLLSRGLLR